MSVQTNVPRRSIKNGPSRRGKDHTDDYQYGNSPREALHPLRWAFDETRAEVIQGLATQHPQEKLFDLIEA
ncbi:hypothetical protein Tco_0992272 [Tanacetum coccineum]|uniref:Uncharacterized protein n=1 Tax=Tanacetum coccineum TaxID=301880 RepID=A0ABQ5F2B2_9ASTR